MLHVGIGIWLVLAVLVALGARNRGRSGIGWFVLSCVISPVLSGIALVVLGSRRDRISRF